MLLTWFTNTGAPGYTLTRFSEAGERLDTPLGNNETVALTAANEHATAYLTTPESMRALDLATLSTLWTSATAATPLAAGLDRGAIVHTSTGLVTMDGTGQPVATAPALDLFNAVQFRYGLWTGRAPTGELEARVSTPFEEAPVSFAQGMGSASAQRKAKVTIFDRDDVAAVLLLDYIFPESVANQLEFGGRVCRRPDGRFQWGPIKVGTATSVDLDTIPPVEHCSAFGTTVGLVHTHWQNIDPVTGWPYTTVNTPSGYLSYANYIDADGDSTNGNNGSDLKIADDLANGYAIFGTAWEYVVAHSPPGSNTVRFMRYRGPESKKNVWVYNVVGDTWVKLPNAPW